ncbi:MAG: hypothetical protein HZC40_04545 [Chloroflexi bacterium]|nr:hypothetical protein [Chloroflexota bacterium]
MTSVRIGGLEIGVIILTLATALIHLTLNFPDVMFILNGLGYLSLLAALFLRVPIPMLAQKRALIRWAFIAFTAITILGWLAIGDKTLPNGMVGYITKAIEIILIALLFIEARKK